MAVEERDGELCWVHGFRLPRAVAVSVPSPGMVTLPRDVNDGRAIVAHELEVLPPVAQVVAHAFASAVATGDWPALAALLHDEVDFRGLTTVRAWLAVGPDQMCAVLREWGVEEGRPARLDHVDVAGVTDRYRVTYRLMVAASKVRAAAGYEHTVYFDLDANDRITFVRMLSSGAQRPSRRNTPTGAGSATTR